MKSDAMLLWITEKSKTLKRPPPVSEETIRRVTASMNSEAICAVSIPTPKTDHVEIDMMESVAIPPHIWLVSLVIVLFGVAIGMWASTIIVRT